MKSLNNEQLQFFMNEVLGELNWGDEDDASGIDPLEFVRNEIRGMGKKITRLQGSLELRDAAQQSVQPTSCVQVIPNTGIPVQARI